MFAALFLTSFPATFPAGTSAAFAEADRLSVAFAGAGLGEAFARGGVDLAAGTRCGSAVLRAAEEDPERGVTAAGILGFWCGVVLRTAEGAGKAEPVADIAAS
ncbi:MAG: hypothetical protein IJM72_07100 [Deltaproteobacteria bacterium]|nr:hypothetical protein [Deltaproteobacteria bacterium]